MDLEDRGWEKRGLDKSGSSRDNLPSALNNVPYSGHVLAINTSTCALNKTQFMTSIKLQHVSAPG
jgi:hypothetical protein